MKKKFDFCSYYHMKENQSKQQLNNMRGSKFQTASETFCTFFLFINSGSGAGLGTKIVSQQIRHISFEIPIDSLQDIRAIDVYFINMRKNKSFGFMKLKQLNNMKKKAIAIVVGGDGTVMWVVNEFQRFNIDYNETPIGIIPTGTGNDFSRALKWGGQKTMLLQNNFRSLKKLIRKWLHAKQSNFDVWDMTAETFPYGKFEKVQSGNNFDLQSTTFKRSFVNYFSFGIDGKVGYSFEMHRTTSRIGNLAMYGVLGIIKQATKSKTVDQLVQSFYIKNSNQNSETCIFKSKTKEQEVSTDIEYITPGLKNILMLNIDSYTGGVQGIWSSAKEMFNSKNHNGSQCMFNDGKLEVLSFSSGMAIAMERSIGGFGNRITQSEGPFVFNFRTNPEQQKFRTYLQVDGQFIRFTHPKRITVEKSKLIKGGKIKVLVNDPNFEPFIPED